MILVTALQALWGSSIPISKLLLNMSSPIFLAGSRMSAAGIILLIYNYCFNNQQFQFKRNHLWLYIQIIFFGIYLKYILRNWGLAQLSTIKMSFMLNGTPFCVALFSYGAFKERLSIKQWIGLCIGFVGLIPFILTTPSNNVSLQNNSMVSWAELAIVGEIIAHSYGLILSRKMIKDIGYSPTMLNGIRMLGGGVIALITSFFIETHTLSAPPITFIGWLAILVFISNIVCHNLYLYLLNQYSATFLSFSDFLSPIFVALYSCLFLQEKISYYYLISSFIVFIGLYLFYKDEL